MRLRTRLCRLPGKLERAERALVGQVDLLRVHVVQELLGVERVPLRAARRPGRGAARAPRCRRRGAARASPGPRSVISASSSAVEPQLLDLRAARRGRAPAAAPPRGGRRARAARDRARRRARSRRGGRARAGRASGSPRARARAARCAARARRQSASRFSSDVLRSLASNELVSSVSGIDRPSTTSRSGARATSAGSIVRERLLERLRPARRSGSVLGQPEQRPPDLAPDEVARASSRRTDTRRTRRRTPRRRASRTNSAISRDLPIPASAEMPTISPRPAAAASRPRLERGELGVSPDDRERRSGSRAASGAPTMPVSAYAATGSALPFSSSGSSFVQVKPLAGQRGGRARRRRSRPAAPSTSAWPRG